MAFKVVFINTLKHRIVLILFAFVLDNMELYRFICVNPRRNLYEVDVLESQANKGSTDY
jgi:hypothetical protein